MLDRIYNFISYFLTEKENKQQLPQAFVIEMERWICTHFLENDLKMKAKLCDVSKSTDYKKGLLEMKLESLQSTNPNFKEDLESQINKFEKTLQTTDNQLFIGNVHNAALNSTISSGGNIQFGDTTTINHYYGNAREVAQPQTGSNTLTLIQENRLEDALQQLRNNINASEDYKYLQMDITMLTARFSRLQNEENQGTIAVSDANLERNKITKSLLALLEKVDC